MDNRLLSSLIVLRHKLHTFHWNVQGHMFLELHHLFQKQYEDTLLYADRVAEHIRAKDAYPITTLSQMIETSIIKETVDIHQSDHMINILIDDFDTLAYTINRYQSDDRAMNNILDDIYEWSTKQVWFLKSLAQ